LDKGVYSSAIEQLDPFCFVEFDKDFLLAGRGKPTRVECGKFKRFMGCARMDKHKLIYYKSITGEVVDYRDKISHKRVWYYCRKAQCPICFARGWAVEEAKRAEARIEYAQKKFRKEAFHVIVSFKIDDFKGSFADLKKYIHKYILSVGIVGGLEVFHHLRYHGANETYVGERPHFFRGSHFHVLGFLRSGYVCRGCHNLVKDGTSKVFDREKCLKCNGFEGITRRAYDKAVERGKLPIIVKVKEKRKTYGGTIWYELTHASLKVNAKQQRVVNWFGTCGRNKLKIPKGELPQHENLCFCGEKLNQRLSYIGDLKEYLMFLDAMGYKRSEVVTDTLHDENGHVKWVVIERSERRYSE